MVSVWKKSVFMDTLGSMRQNTQAQNEAVKWKVEIDNVILQGESVYNIDYDRKPPANDRQPVETRYQNK